MLSVLGPSLAFLTPLPPIDAVRSCMRGVAGTAGPWGCQPNTFNLSSLSGPPGALGRVRMSYQPYYVSTRASVEAYRASPVLQRNADGGRHGGRAAAGGRHAGEHGGAPVGPEIYGFSFAAGLPGFEGSVAAATLGGPSPAPEAAYLALLCLEGLADFRQGHSWAPQVVPSVETALRTIVQQCTPSGRELQMRLQAMARLKELAQSGIHFCVGLDLEPYGSFVSGLYTPTGDLDLSIEGHATWQDEAGRVQRVTVDGMEREMKVKFLRALANRIQAKRICAGQVERILHARVPILKFQDPMGLSFDVGIGGSQALFKSTVLGLLAQYDWRFGALLRLVKLWARHYGINDSANGTFNSFALTLLVLFHLQTRSPAVLPPLCQLFGGGPGAARPMQEGSFPDWNLLTAACERLSQMGRQGGPSPAGANSETLLELLASFFALFEGLLCGGWALGKGADSEALRGVLRRVRVDTWGGRLRYERWDKEGYCCSVEDPFDSTDNCARTVRKEERLAGIVHAAARGRELLLELESPDQAARALEELFGRGGLHPNLTRDLLRPDGRSPAVEWIPPVDLIIPPRIQGFTNGRMPRAVHVDHQRQRGLDERHAWAGELQHQLELLTLSSVARQHAQHAQQAQHTQELEAAVLPPPGLAPVHVAAAEASAVVPAVPGLAPGAALPVAAASISAGVQRAQRDALPATLLSLQQLRQAMEPEVAEEAARLAEIERKEAEAAAAAAAAKEKKREAKRAAAKAAREAKAEERRRARAERGRSRSRSRASHASRSRSRHDGAAGGSRAASPALQAALSAAAAAAVTNLGQASHLAAPAAGSTGDAAANAQATPAAALAGTVQAPAVERTALAAQLLPPVAAGAAQLGAHNTATAAAASGSAGSEVEGGTEPAAPLAAATAAAAVAQEGLEQAGGPGLDGSGKRKERRHGKNMKTAFKGRQQRRAAGGEPTAPAAAGAPPPGLAAPPQQQPQQEPAGAAAVAHQRRSAMQAPGANGTDARQRQRQGRGHGGRGGGQQQRGGRAEGSGGAACAPSAAPSGAQANAAPLVLRVTRRQGGRNRGAQGPLQAHAASAPAVTLPA